MYLVHQVGGEGIATDPAKIEAIRKWPTPTSLEDVQTFLVLASYYRKLVKNLSTIASPLTRLTRKEVKFEWFPEC